ncbi:enhancer of polycomb homolog 2 isoform X2 [Chionomys nivalis]|uniref:enhancer of polycomb homolog 2 isoform X2 n=1 Tax=Arvicola amphibius TaxID=1047088 RepID=UPI0018E3A2DB|nr:enhancer of polycomb homolog 2 isoform X2 [Arvicola amphibius]XP_048281646.1 enhancer of polycomb homolog 2 isoform X2 [Myodes glareolus]XP_057611162.1 enhancer of polycomb homolog 2 isoform X2 [Chionomys nivalis]
MSKLSFRARALDAAKPLPIYRGKDMPDLNDCVSINRAVPQMPTGMEKEEESEHHLQRAISAQQVFREKKESMVIPVPEAESNVNYYNRLYKGEFKQPKQFIHIQPFNLDNEQPDYDMDSEDETLLNRLNRKMEIKPLQFEIMIDRLEKASSNQLVTLQEAKLLLNEDDYLIKAVYDYWVRKRKNCRGPSLIPQIKQEKRDGSTNNDPYVAFRRRTEKMQTRKNRKNDEASYEKMLKLRREFSRAITILEMIKRREKTKRELLHLTLEVVEKRYHLGDYGGEILNEVKVNRSEKELYATPATLHNGNHHKVQECKTKVPSPASEPEEENDPDGPCAFRRRAGCQYYAPRLDHTCENSELADLDKLRYKHCLTTLTVPRRCIGFARRRIGRGGRVIMDRISTEHDPVLKQIDPEMLNGSSSSSQTIDFSSNFSRTNASSKPCENRLSLSEILSNIRSCRLQCFQPRLLNVQDIDNEECTSRKPGQTVSSRRVSAASVALLNTSKNGISVTGGITEEQFQTHQQQLVQMQRQQLAQLQQKQQSQHSSQQTHPKAQGSGTSDCMSKTLDSASAHFAASAVVSAPVPSRSEVSKEQNTGHNNMNGVVQPSGPSKTLYSTNMALSSSAGISAVQLVRTVGHTTTNHLIPALCTSSPQPLPMNNSCLTNAVHLNNVSVVSPVNVHINTRTSAPSPTALKLATVAASMDRVPKVTPSSAISSMARENHEPERLGLNGIAETTVAMEVT